MSSLSSFSGLGVGCLRVVGIILVEIVNIGLPIGKHQNGLLRSGSAIFVVRALKRYDGQRSLITFFDLVVQNQ